MTESSEQRQKNLLRNLEICFGSRAAANMIYHLLIYTKRCQLQIDALEKCLRNKEIIGESEVQSTVDDIVNSQWDDFAERFPEIKSLMKDFEGETELS